MKKLLLTGLLPVAFGGLTSHAKSVENVKPNVIVIMADDLGYGDVSVYDRGTLKTPNMDRIGKEGIVFTNGYATSATCTPSRYSLITGEYPWRNDRAQVLAGDAPLLIDPASPTLPKMLKKAGYQTAVIGKWHLGLGNGKVDWNKHIPLNPNDVGFDYSYIMAATNDRVPNVFVQDGKVVGLDPADPLYVSYRKNFEGEPTGKEHPEMLKMMYSHGHNQSINNGVSRIGYQKGGKAAQWIDENMADTFLVRSQNYIKKHKNKPFFLYYALHQPHVPRVPHSRFAGTTGMGPRGDAIAEADWCVGELLKTLDEEGLMENTIVIFSSDNGPVMDDGYKDDSQEKLGDHTPRGLLRGGKYSLFEAGTRVPFLLMWKGHVKGGKTSEALVCQVDLFASLAKMVNQELPNNDSQDILPALTGKSKKGREGLIIEGLGHRTAYRKGDWVVIPAYKGSKMVSWGVSNETGFNPTPEIQFYNLKKDEKQQDNLYSSMPEKAEELLKEMEELKK
ncbi:arylsulfatase [Puteibacter caeruleilacunae]|nr:arylsulfatase [Puteibacter caeruleilacunae]